MLVADAAAACGAFFEQKTRELPIFCNGGAKEVA